jgi:trigger factor
VTEIVEDRTTVEATDLVDVSYSTRILDENDKEIKSHEPGETTIDLGTDGLRQEIVTALMGKEIGAHVEVEVPIEEDNPDTDIAGQRAVYSFDIKGIKIKNLPEMDQEFFQKVTGEENLSLESFTNKMKDGIAARLENEIRTEMEDIAVNKLAEMSDFTIPETLVTRQEETIRKQDEENFKNRFNKTIDEFLDEGSLDREEYESNLKDQARKSVGRYLVMDALSTRENVDVTKEDIQAEIAQIASSYRIDPERLMGSILQDPDRIGEISNRIRYRKTVDILLDGVTVTEGTDADKAEELPDTGVTEE